MLRNSNTTTVGVLIACFTVTWLMLDDIRRDLKGDIAAMEARLGERIAVMEARLTRALPGQGR